MHYSDQEIYKLVKIVKPEIIYSAQTHFEGIKLLTHCRNKATNFHDVLKKIKDDQGGKIRDEQKKYCRDAADAEILNLLSKEHQLVIEIALKRQQSLQKIFNAAGKNTANAVCRVLDGVSGNLKKIAQIEDSRKQLLRYNNVYRGQKKMTLELLEIEGVDSAIIAKVKHLYKPQSVNTLIPVWEKLTDWENSETLKLLKQANAFAKLTEFGNAN